MYITYINVYNISQHVADFNQRLYAGDIENEGNIDLFL